MNLSLLKKKFKIFLTTSIMKNCYVNTSPFGSVRLARPLKTTRHLLIASHIVNFIPPALKTAFPSVLLISVSVESIQTKQLIFVSSFFFF